MLKLAHYKQQHTGRPFVRLIALMMRMMRVTETLMRRGVLPTLRLLATRSFFFSVVVVGWRRRKFCWERHAINLDNTNAASLHLSILCPLLFLSILLLQASQYKATTKS